MFNKLIQSTFALFLYLVTQSASALPILDIDTSGKLIGANNVSVSGLLYDVTFSGGTCASLFDGCDDSADFLFTTEADASAASQALLDQVFIDTILGLFDSSPGLTVGCLVVFSSECWIATPYQSAGSSISGQVAHNRSGLTPDDLSGIGFHRDFDPGAGGLLIYAKWTPSASASVPEPSSLATLALGMIALAATRKKCRDRSA